MIVSFVRYGIMLYIDGKKIALSDTRCLASDWKACQKKSLEIIWHLKPNKLWHSLHFLNIETKESEII